MWARLASPDAALIEAALEETARSTCHSDPRSIDERRAKALTALVTHTALACACGESDCPGERRADAAPTKNAVVYVIADEKSVDAAEADSLHTDPPGLADDPTEPTDEDADNADDTGVATPTPEAARSPQRCAAPPAFVFGGGILPTPLLGAILERATIREVRHPGDAPPEPRYAPSRALCEFVRCRDLTCRFPGCDKPAQFCDLDHTVPYPVGPTHPSNLKCLCRFHHLLKTFWNGVKGWRDRQLPDGRGFGRPYWLETTLQWPL
jgi:hypothetical protein